MLEADGVTIMVKHQKEIVNFDFAMVDVKKEEENAEVITAPEDYQNCAI